MGGGRRWQPGTLRDIASWAQVQRSGNFLHFAASLPPGAPLNEYLRPVGALMLFRSGKVLLVSECEADQLLGSLRGSGGGGAGDGASAAAVTDAAPLLVDLCYARQAAAGAAPGGLGRRCGWGYGSEAQQRALRALLWQLRQEVEALVGMRGKGALLALSDLAGACEGP